MGHKSGDRRKSSGSKDDYSSRKRDRRRSRSRSRSGERNKREKNSSSRHQKDFSNSRSVEKSTGKSYSKERSDSREKNKKNRSERDKKRIREKDIDLEKPIDSKEMEEMMGFSSFDTTKNKHIVGNVDPEMQVKKPRKYRQYMNRKGGFNRDLDPVQ